MDTGCLHGFTGMGFRVKGLGLGVIGLSKWISVTPTPRNQKKDVFLVMRLAAGS